MAAKMLMTRKSLQEQSFLREMDLTPVTMVNCLRSTHSDVMHIATTVLTFQQPDQPKGFGAKLNMGAQARALDPKKRKQRVKPIATRKKHLALLREHADFMARLTAERTERLEIESWAASMLQVAVRRFLHRTDRRYGGGEANVVQARPDRFLQSMRTPGVEIQDELKALIHRSTLLVEAEDDDLDKMPPWQRQEVARQREVERIRHEKQIRLKVAVKLQSMARGYMGRKATRFFKLLEVEERQMKAATFIQSHARVFTAKNAEHRLQLRRIAKSVVIQAAFRGYVDRLIVRVIHGRLDQHVLRVDAATRFQALVRGFQARQAVRAKVQTCAAIRIQASVRARHAQNQIKHQKEVKAATMIQAHVRQHHAIAVVQHEREVQAATKIETAQRASAARTQLKAKRHDKAATKIQAAVRSKGARLAAEKQVRDEAATAIQAAQRGKAARQLAEAKEQSALAVQKVVRGAAGRTAVKQEKEAATKIQAARRGQVARKEGEKAAAAAAAAAAQPKEVEGEGKQEEEHKEPDKGEKVDEEPRDGTAATDEGVPTVTEEGELDAEAAAATKLQAVARGQAVRTEVDAQNKAAVEVQKVVRGRQDRAVVDQLREERKQALEAEAEAQDRQARSAKRRDIP